jgi:hypothetical protein
VVEAPKKKSKKKQMEAEEEVTYQSSFLPVYDYMIPHNPKAQLNGDFELHGLRDLYIAETTFESTAVVFAYGKDLFWCKVTPDKMFDMLNDDFNYLMLIAIAVGITVSFSGLNLPRLRPLWLCEWGAPRRPRIVG